MTLLLACLPFCNSISDVFTENPPTQWMKDICKPIAVGSLRTIFVYFLRRLFTFLLSLKNGPIISAKGCSLPEYSIPCFPIVLVDIHLGCSDLRSSQDASIYFCPYSSCSLSEGAKNFFPEKKWEFYVSTLGGKKSKGSQSRLGGGTVWKKNRT